MLWIITVNLVLPEINRNKLLKFSKSDYRTDEKVATDFHLFIAYWKGLSGYD